MVTWPSLALCWKMRALRVLLFLELGQVDGLNEETRKDFKSHHRSSGRAGTERVHCKGNLRADGVVASLFGWNFFLFKEVETRGQERSEEGCVFPDGDFGFLWFHAGLCEKK